MLRFPLDVRCVSVPDTLALFSRTRVCSDQKENDLALSRYIRDCRQNWNNSLDYCFSAWFWDVRTSPQLINLLIFSRRKTSGH